MIHGNNRPFSHNVTMGKHEVHQKNKTSRAVAGVAVHYKIQAGDTLRSISPVGNRCHFVLLDKHEKLSNS